jgi:hypothetical protein
MSKAKDDAKLEQLKKLSGLARNCRILMGVADSNIEAVKLELKAAEKYHRVLNNELFEFEAKVAEIVGGL